jgi:hypothetical protein
MKTYRSVIVIHQGELKKNENNPEQAERPFRGLQQLFYQRPPAVAAKLLIASFILCTKYI